MKSYYLTFTCFLLVATTGISRPLDIQHSLVSIQTISDTLTFHKGCTHLDTLIAQNKHDDAIKLADQLVQKATAIGYEKGAGRVYWRKGILYDRLEDYANSLVNYDKALKYYTKTHNNRAIASIHLNKAKVEQSKGNYSKGIEYLLEAHLFYKKDNDSSSLAKVYNNLAIAYSDLGDHPRSKKYYKNAISIAKELRMKLLGSLMNNLALSYIDNKKVDSAKTILTESLAIAKQEKVVRSIAQSYSLLAKVALHENELAKAQKYYDSTLAVGKQLNWKALLLNAKQQMALIAIKEKKYKKATELLQHVRKELATIGAISLQLKNYKFSYQLDSLQGNYFSALSWQQKYQQLSDKKTTAMVAKKIKTAENRHQAELAYQTLINEQEKEEQRTEASLFRYRVTIFIISGVLIISLIFTTLVIRTRKERKRYIKELNASNKIKNRLFSIISHDLRNEIHGLHGSLNLMKENEIPTEEFLEVVPLLANRTQQTAILLNNLLNWSKSQLNQLNAKPTHFDISEIICDKFAFFSPEASQKNIQLINNLAATPIYADKDMIGIVAQNLIANAIKFCNAGDIITLEAKENEQSFDICFRDTGIGIAAQHIHKLFAEETFSTCGTNNEKGTGLGLKICKELIELNQGKIEVQSTVGKGSIFRVSLPKAA